VDPEPGHNTTHLDEEARGQEKTGKRERKGRQLLSTHIPIEHRAPGNPKPHRMPPYQIYINSMALDKALIKASLSNSVPSYWLMII
jgi:hypothetical protein